MTPEKCTRHEWEAIGDLHFPEITQDYCKKCNVSKVEYDSYQRGFNEGIDEAIKLIKNYISDDSLVHKLLQNLKRSG